MHYKLKAHKKKTYKCAFARLQSCERRRLSSLYKKPSIEMLSKEYVSSWVKQFNGLVFVFGFVF